MIEAKCKSDANFCRDCVEKEVPGRKPKFLLVLTEIIVIALNAAQMDTPPLPKNATESTFLLNNLSKLTLNLGDYVERCFRSKVCSKFVSFPPQAISALIVKLAG